MNEQELRNCPYCSSDKLQALTTVGGERIIRCTKCGVNGLDILWDTRHTEDKLSNTIDVLTKKYANVQFVNKKLQEKIKRQSERITQLESLYREEIKTKKETALKARAEKAEAVEVEALRLRKNQEAQISEMRRVGNLMADHLNALGISRHDREWADASNVLPEMIHENKDEKMKKTVTCKDCKHSEYRAGIDPRLAAKYNFADTNPYPTHKCLKYGIRRRRTNLSGSIFRFAACIRDNGGEQADKS